MVWVLGSVNSNHNHNHNHQHIYNPNSSFTLTITQTLTLTLTITQNQLKQTVENPPKIIPNSLRTPKIVSAFCIVIARDVVHSVNTSYLRAVTPGGGAGRTGRRALPGKVVGCQLFLLEAVIQVPLQVSGTESSLSPETFHRHMDN